ncbi:MAG: DUF6350 family protein [Mycobacteriales bacterium]|nr:DUF6350 family protein [Frankia sp.]
MTQTLVRPRAASAAPRAAQPKPEPAVGVVVGGALFAALTGLVVLEAVVLLAWAADAHSGASSDAALRTGAQLWLLGHRVPLQVAGARVTLAPLGVSLLAATLHMRAVGTVVRRLAPSSLAGAGACAVAAAVPYATVVATVAVVASTSQVHVDAMRALVAALGFALVAGGVGALHGFGARRAASVLPAPVVTAVCAAGVGLLVLVAGGGVLGMLALIGHGGRAVELSNAVAPGAVGAAGLLLCSLALVPNAVVWGSAFTLGPGFAVGTATVVAPGALRLGAVPALPLLAGLPSGAAMPLLAWAALVVPIAAAVAAAAVVRRRERAATAVRLAALVAASACLAAVAVTALAWASGGAAGPERLRITGPAPWSVGLATFTWVVACGVPVAVLRREAPRRSRTRSR